MTIARNAAIENKSATAIFSLEMSSDQLGQRLLTSEARVDNALVRRGSPNIKWKILILLQENLLKLLFT